jgi:hypothetical protein
MRYHLPVVDSIPESVESAARKKFAESPVGDTLLAIVQCAASGTSGTSGTSGGPSDEPSAADSELDGNAEDTEVEAVNAALAAAEDQIAMPTIPLVDLSVAEGKPSAFSKHGVTPQPDFVSDSFSVSNEYALGGRLYSKNSARSEVHAPSPISPAVLTGVPPALPPEPVESAGADELLGGG